MAPPILSDSEMKLLALSWQCFEAPPQVDIEKLAKLYGHSNSGSTRNAMAAIKKKLAAIAAEIGDGSSTTNGTISKRATPAKVTQTKGKGNPKKRQASTPAEQDDQVKAEDASESESGTAKQPPKKRCRGRPAKAKSAPVSNASEDEEVA